MALQHIPANDQARLEAVRRYDVLDTPPDGAFDRITALAARLFNVPIALVTIVDEDRIWFKSRYGLDAITQIPRDPGLCASAICGEEPYIVEHARKDPRSFENPLVAGAFGLQFYAAAPLRTQDGYNLGTFCLLGREPRTFSEPDRETLSTLAAIVVDELELRLEALQTIASERRLREESRRLAIENGLLYRREHQVASTLQTAMLPHGFPDVPDVVFDAVYEPAASQGVVGGDWYDAFVVGGDHLVLSIGDVMGHGLNAAALMGKVRQSLRTIALDGFNPAQILSRLNRVLLTEGQDLIVTAVVAIVDLHTRGLEYASAGHPPPLLRASDGTLVALERTGLPLGLRAEEESVVHKLQIGAGSLLVLYTDGLTECTRDLIEGERLLRQTLASEGIALAEQPAVALKNALVPGPAPDDVAVLTVNFR